MGVAYPACFLCRSPTPPPPGRSMSALSFGAEVSSLRQEDLVVTDALPASFVVVCASVRPRSLCLPSCLRHPSTAAVLPTPKRPRRFRVDCPALSPCMEVSGFRHILSAALRGYPAKGIDIYLPSMARPLHLAMRSQSTPEPL